MVCNLAGSPLQVHVALTDVGKVYTASKLQRCIKQCRLKALFKLCETFVFWVGYRRGSERGGGECRARFTGIKIENSRFTGIKTDFSRITHNSAFDFHGSREINSFFHDSRQLKNRCSRFTENPLSDPRRRKVFAQVALQKCIHKNCMKNWLVVLQRGAVGTNISVM